MILEKYLEDPVQFEKVKKGSYVILFLVVMIDIFISHEHGHYIWDKIPGFYSFYGLLGSFILIFVSKFLGHLFLTKDEDYYD